ncbi:MAG: aminopeptidase [Thermoflexales bacterium]|nr:aminopeptidase [Thermoflexales bacterium]MDW8292394.1 aminopeptidase [Anaerolineae bacterium]
MAQQDFALWLAWRAVRGLGVEAGELVLVRDQAGHDAMLREVAAAIAEAGATPLVEIATPNWLARALAHAPREALLHFDRHRRAWLEQCHRVLTLDGGTLDAVHADPERMALWNAAQARLLAVEESRAIPHLVVAVPTPEKAEQLGWSLETLESHLLDAQHATLFELERPMDRLLLKAGEAHHILLRAAEGDALHITRSEKSWRRNDGYIDPEDVAQGNVIATLPAGTIETLLAPEQAHGTITVPGLGTLRFDEGQVVQVLEGANEHAESCLGAVLRALRIGLNPTLRQPLGWTWVDQLIHGTVTLDFGDHALGEITLHNVALWLGDWQAFGG